MRIKNIKQNKNQKKYGIVSTAAETKFQMSNVESQGDQIFIEDNQNYNNNGNYLVYKGNEKDKKSFNYKTPKINGMKHYQDNKLRVSAQGRISGRGQLKQSSKSSINMLKQHLFCRVTSISIIESQKSIQQIIKDSKSIQKFSQYICYQSLKQLSQILLKNTQLPLVQQFSLMNTRFLLQQKTGQILQNYSTSLQLQYPSFISSSIQQITQILKIFYDEAIQQYYNTINNNIHNNINQQLQKQYYFKLLQNINLSQSSLLKSIKKGKRQQIQRKMQQFEDENYMRQYEQNCVSKFQNFIGQRMLNDVQIGYDLYRLSMKDRIGAVFQQLIEDRGDQNDVYYYGYTNNKSSINDDNNNQSSFNQKNNKRNNMTKNQFNQNIQKRIQILKSQKINIQQSLHFQQSLQENLVEYLKGIQAKSGRENKMQREMDIREEDQD